MSPMQAWIARRADALPLPIPGFQWGGKAHLPSVFAIPKSWTHNFGTALMAEGNGELYVGVGIGVALTRQKS